ncbi:MAG: hypothetical protein AAB281_06755 [Actinomycetota bacterium]
MRDSISQYLQQNAQAYALFKEATGLAYCDFWNGTNIQELKFLEVKWPYPSSELGHLARLALQQGRRFHARGETAQALESYLAVLRLGHHLGQEPRPTVMGKLLEVYFQELAYGPLHELLHDTALPSTEFRSAARALESLRSQWAGLDRAFQTEPPCVDVRRSGFADHIRAQAAAEGKPFDKRMEAILRSGLDQVYVAEQKLCARLQAAARKNAPDEYDAYADLMTGEAKSQLKPYRIIGDWLTQIPRVLFGNLDGKEQSVELLGTVLSNTLLAVGYPKADKVITRYHLNRTRQNILLAASAVRSYEIEQGHAPESLPKLIPEYLAGVPEDPFGGGQPLRYVIEESLWRLYSVGPDGEDQQGMQQLNRKAGRGPVDVVF